jgi:hypothetical protein
MRTKTPTIYLTSASLPPKNDTIRLYTKYYKFQDPHKVRPDDCLAEVYLFTAAHSFTSLLKRKHVNKELAWNCELLGRL